VLLVPDMQAALELVEEGLDVVAGELDDPETYRRVNVDRASLVVATGTDMLNTNIAFTVREQDARVPILATARSREAGEILQLAGCTQVIRLGKMLGEAFARRTIGGDARAHVIGQMDELLVAEASAAGTPLVGKLLRDTRLRETTGINIVGISERGRFAIPRPDTAIGENSILVLAGSADHIERYNELFCIYHVTTGRVIIVGAGRVGRSVAEAMEERGTDYCLVDVIGEKVPDPGRAVIGNAADSRVLERAGIRDAPAVVITTRDDDMNIYLTIFCRKLRKDIQIISRATAERNVATLYRAGADIVMSYASMGSNLIYNYYRHSDVVMLAGGLNVFRSGVPEQLVGRSLAESDIRRLTGCNVAAIRTPERFLVNPNPQEILAGGCELVLIGTEESERAFLRLFG
jgi:Trk K+ transport system NAD-binding subunit